MEAKMLIVSGDMLAVCGQRIENYPVLIIAFPIKAVHLPRIAIYRIIS